MKSEIGTFSKTTSEDKSDMLVRGILRQMISKSLIVKPRPKSQTPKAQPQPSQIQSKSQIPGLGLTLKSYATPPPHHHPITFRSSVWDYMVQVEAPSTPECQEGVPSQGGHQREEHRVVHHHGSERSPEYP